MHASSFHGVVRIWILLAACLLVMPQAAMASGKWGKLYVETDPPDASIRFLRIKYAYEPGIILRQGRYLVEVSKPGFEPVVKEVEVYAGKRNVARVSLYDPGLSAPPVEDEAVSAAELEAAQPVEQEVEPEKDLRVPLSRTMQVEEEPKAGQAEEGEKARRFDRGFGPMPRPMRSKASEPEPRPEPEPDSGQGYSGQLSPDEGAATRPVTPQPAEQAPAPEPAAEPDLEAQPAQEPDAGLPPISEENPPSPEELMQVANHLTQAGDLANAIEGFTLVLQQQPSNVNAYVGRGFAYYKLGNYAFAIEDMTRALELDQQHLSAWFHRGNAYLMAGELEKAVQDYERALALSDTVPDIYNARGTALYNMGALDAAIQDFDRAILLDPDYADALFNRGSAYLKQGKAQLALDDFDAVLALKPDDGLAMKKRKQAQKALRP